MRIAEIRINGLFDMFDHVIPLNLDKHLTILYGANGIGKTMVFRVVNSIFNAIYNLEFNSIQKKFPFKKICLRFDNQDSLVINYPKNIEEWEGAAPVLEFKNTQINDAFRAEHEILKPIRKQIKTYFITTQRLLDFSEIEVKETATIYAQEFAQLLHNKNIEHAELSAELKLSLNERVMRGEAKTDLSIEELKKTALRVQQKRQELISMGVMQDNNHKDSFIVPDGLDAIKQAILAVNLQDMETQLAVYDKDNFRQRLLLFLDILNNRRLAFKQISVNEKDGFVFINEKDKRLIPAQLSSGEQHELVLLYLLLFKIPENALVLIDEPEISLHIVWQKQFVKDMLDIISFRKFDVILATHSPAIINGHWDLTVQLTGNHETVV